MTLPGRWLEELLRERPDVIPASAIRQGAGPLQLAVGPFEAGGGGLLGFSGEGEVAVISFPAGEDANARSGALLGSVLEQAAAVGGKTYVELDAFVHDRLGLGLADAMDERLAARSPGVAWDRRGFEERVGQAVEGGDLAIVIVLDRQDERLLRTIRFLWDAWAVVLPIHVVVLSRAEGDWQAEIVY